jgi:hypothetical protein
VWSTSRIDKAQSGLSFEKLSASVPKALVHKTMSAMHKLAMTTMIYARVLKVGGGAAEPFGFLPGTDLLQSSHC